MRIILAVLFLVLVFVFVRFFDAREFLLRLQDTGPWAPCLFILAYVCATVFFVPGWVLTLGAGVLFGVVKGSVIVSIGSVIGATCAFIAGRYFARDWISKKIQGNPKFDALDKGVAKEGWKIVLLTRLSPLFPFNLLNYAYGLTRVSLRDYFFASWIGMIPGTVMYVYLGSVAGDLAAASAGARSKTPMEWALYGVGLLATIGITFYVTRIAKRALSQRV